MTLPRLAAIAAGATFSVLISTAAGAVGSESECVSLTGTVMDVNGVNSCLVPVIPEEFQGEEYANDIKGVNTCTGALRKTSIGDYCLIALEAKPANMVSPAAVVTEGASDQINAAIGEASDAKAEMAADAVEAPKKKRGFFGNRN